MSTFEVRVSPLVTSGGTVRVAAELRSPTRSNDELWYELDEAHRGAIVGRADPFVVGALVLAMYERCDLHVRGAPASTSLLRNLQEFQQIWHAWFDYPIIDVVVEECEDAPRDGTVVSFSGGVDSAFTAYWHTKAASPRHRDLRAALMMHGMDIPRSDTRGFAGARARSERMLQSLGLDLVAVTTNAFELPANDHVHFPALGVASALHVLGGGFGTGLIPSTGAYGQFVLPLDSTPVSDGYLGGNSFPIVHDGAAFNRLEKVRRLVEWDEAVDNLRVCLESPSHDRNCGRCRKCLLTYLAFRVLRVEPRCFDTIPSPATVESWAGTFTSHRLFVADMSAIVEEADRHGLNEPWVRAAKRRLRVVAARRALTQVSPQLSRRAAQLAWKLRRR